MKTLFLAALLVAAASAKVTLDLTTHPDKVYGTPVQLSVGEYFEVMFKENPTTGYTWQL